jgi:hypothetical protein
MLILDSLAGTLVLIALGFGALLAMAGTMALALGIDDPKFDPRHVELAAIVVIFLGLALFIAGTAGCIELMV